MAFAANAEAQTIIPKESQSLIRHRHWYDAANSPNLPHFYRSITMKKLDFMAKETIKHGSVLPAIDGPGKKIHQYKYPKAIGVNSQGVKAYFLRVVTDEKGNVITAFPV
jgi:hypothetical protein